jgi:two-component system OmpR family sensor kinase
MTGRFSYRTFFISLYLGSLIPLLVVIGLLVYGIQQRFLLDTTRSRLSEFVQAAVESVEVTQSTLNRLAVRLGDQLRVLGADVFIKDAQGDPVPPALGTGPWLDDSQHQQALESQQGSFISLQTGETDRLVYLAPILDAEGLPLGTVEASLDLQFIENELAALRRWLVIVVSGAAVLSVLLSLAVAEVARRPLEGLIRTAGQVALGDMDSRAPLPAVPEPRQLAETFNAMLDGIQAAMEAQAQTTEEMRRFAADASHELRSPLAVFHNGVDMLEKALERADYEHADQVLGLMRNETTSMTRLVDDLLLLARMEASPVGTGRELTLKPVEPVPLLEEVYERANLIGTGQNLELVWPSRQVDTVFADRELLRRALNNLVENAIRHTPAGKNIYLQINPLPAACQFIIADEGAGIPPEDLPHIFERFYRGDAARTRQLSSTGLGLAIVRAIVQAHHGQIQVESQPGQGTRFTLTVPRRNSGSR